VRRWFKADYEEKHIPLWDLPFEMVEHVDPDLQAIIVSECEDQRLVYNVQRDRFQLLSRCPMECRDQHVTVIHQFGMRRIIRGWHQLEEFEDPKTNGRLDVSIDLIRDWKAACDATRERMLRSDAEIEAEQDAIAEADLDLTVAKIHDRLDTGTRSSKVLKKRLPGGGGKRIINPLAPKGRNGPGLILPEHIAAERATTAR